VSRAAGSILYKRDVRRIEPSGHGRARGLVSSRVSGARIDAASFEPPEDLADVVEALWFGRWDLPADAPHVTELLGDPCVHVVAERDSARVVGVWRRRWVRELTGRGVVRGAKLRPGAVRAFFDVEAVALSDRITPLATLLEVDAAGFEAALLDPEADVDGLAALADFLRAWRRPDPDGEVSFAVEVAARLREVDLYRVESLADRAGLSVRALQRLFRKHVGATPKQLLRRVRLQEAALRIERGHEPGLAALAADLGYADQAHLTRDFKAVVGQTPRELERSVHR